MRGQVKVYQKKIVAKRRRRVFLVSLYSFGLVVLVVSGVSFLTQLDSLSIKKVVVEGNNRVSTIEVENSVAKSISGNYNFLFSKQNTFLYPKKIIEDTLLSSLPPIKRVDISRRGLGALVVSITEREPKSKWCSGEVEPRCYLLDETGFIFASEHAQCNEGSCVGQGIEDVDFIYKGVIKEEPVGRNFLSDLEFKKVDFFIQQIENLGIGPTEAFIADTGYITISLKDGGKIYVNEVENFTKVLENLTSLIADKTIVPHLAQFLKNLDYIKTDAGNKMVYKLKI